MTFAKQKINHRITSLLCQHITLHLHNIISVQTDWARYQTLFGVITFWGAKPLMTYFCSVIASWQ